MKVMLINGSPNEKGCTYTALNEIASTLEKNNLETEIFYLGKHPIPGCSGCFACMKTGKCRIDDVVNKLWSKIDTIDGFIFGSPVHFASSSGMLTSFMDRFFFINAGSSQLDYKPAAAIVSCRRGGATASFDQINKYFSISNMPIVSSQYWNMVHGTTPEEVKQDLEGMQIMRTLANNMAWLLKSIAAGKKANISIPQKEERIMTNFIR